MKSTTSAPLLAAAATSLLLGCANPERSRDLANPNVPAMATAQQVCSNCHGMTGMSVSPNFPNLAAQTEPYLITQLSGFKSHGRSDPAGFEYMWGLSRSLSEDQIKGLAAHFAAQPPTLQPVEGDLGRLTFGRTIFETGVAETGVPACMGCHGAKAQGIAIYPRLAGQHADYLVKQLLVFQRGDERPDGAIMKTVVHALTRQNIIDVAGYLQALPGL